MSSQNPNQGILFKNFQHGGDVDIRPLFANAIQVFDAARDRQIDPVTYAEYTNAFLSMPNIGLDEKTVPSERNGRMFQVKILNMKVVRTVRVAGSSLRKLIESGMNNAVPLDVRCLRALMRHQEAVPRNWLNEKEPILFIGTVADRKEGSGKCVYGLKLEKPASRSQFVVRNVDDITEETAYLIAYIAEEFFPRDTEEPVLTARRRGARGLELSDADLNVLADEFRKEQEGENGR